MFVEVVFAYLALQFVVGRGAGGGLGLAPPPCLVGPLLQIGGDVVLAHVVAQRVAYLAAGGGVGVVGVGGAVAFGGAGVVVRRAGSGLLEGGVVHHFVLHALEQVGHGQLYESGQGHLEGGELLHLRLRLRLFEFLGHEASCCVSYGKVTKKLRDAIWPHDLKTRARRSGPLRAAFLSKCFSRTARAAAWS